MTRRRSQIASIDEAIDDIRNGKFVIITDDEDRENEGDLVMAAQFVTPEAINFMAKNGRGLICVPLTGDRIDALRIPIMTDQNETPFHTAFTVTVEARHGVTTGISAPDRARTVQVLIDPRTTPSDIVMPGHTFPLRARDGGVLVRAGQTEASVDLARLAGLVPAAVICEIMKTDGEMARMPDLKRFARRHDRIALVTVQHRRDLLRADRRNFRTVRLGRRLEDAHRTVRRFQIGLRDALDIGWRDLAQTVAVQEEQPPISRANPFAHRQSQPV